MEIVYFIFLAFDFYAKKVMLLSQFHYYDLSAIKSVPLLWLVCYQVSSTIM